MKKLVWLLGLLLCGCAADKRATRDRGQGLDNVPEYPAPEKDRCAGHAGGALKGRCDEAKYLAQAYVKKLHSGDMVCLEGGFGDEPGAACLARARVDDIDQLRVLLDVKDAKPDSKWFNKESHQFWFAEGALVDLYLAEHGY